MSRFPLGGLACAVAIAMALGSTVGATRADFTDSASTTTTAFGAATLGAPGPITCVEQGGLLSTYVDLSWPAVAGARYRLTLESGATVTAITPDVAAGTTTYRLTAQAAASLLSVAGALTVRLRPRAGTNWVAASSSTRSVTRTSLLTLGLDIRC